MYNKILATTLITSICFSITNVACASTMMTNGFYVGGDVGAADLMTKESHAVAPESHQLGSVGTIGGAFIGYDYGFNTRARLAAEVFGEMANQNIKISHGANTYKIEPDYNIGIRILPELVFTPFTIGHIIVGYISKARFNIQDNGVYGTINTTYHQSGIQIGAGVTSSLSDRTFIRFDVVYDSYPSATETGSGLTTPTQSYTNRFSQLGGIVGLVYKFS